MPPTCQKGRGGHAVSSSWPWTSAPDGPANVASIIRPRGSAIARSRSALAVDAHQVCPYSNATRGNIEVTLTVV